MEEFDLLLEGDLATEADLALAGIITEYVFRPDEDDERLCQDALDALRLAYWSGFNDQAALWLSANERERACQQIFRLRSDLSVDAIADAIAAGQMAAAAILASLRS